MKELEGNESNKEIFDKHNSHLWCVAFSESKNIYDVDLLSNRDKMEKIFPNYGASWIIIKTFPSQQEAVAFVKSKYTKS